MNKLFKSVGAITLGLAMAAGVGVGVSSKVEEAKADSNYVLVSSLTEGDQVLIVSQQSDTYYVLTTSNGSSKSPTALSVTVSSDSISADLDTHLFTVEASGSNWKFKNGTNYLYTIKDNKGLRIGTNTDNIYQVTSETPSKSYYSMMNTETSRFVGLYNNADWRSYTTKDSTNYDGSGVSIQFFKKSSSPVVPIPLEDIGIEKSSEEVIVGNTVKLNPVYTPSNANTLKTLSWSSDNESIATVDANGVVTGVSVGTCNITINATDISKSAVCALTVNPIPPVPVTHTIADCYDVATGTSVKFNGLFMGQYGLTPKEGLFFADGEYGIMIYGTTTVPSMWEVGKTVVAISGKTAFYNGLVQISNASFELTTATVSNPIDYTITGKETTNTVLSRKSSVSGVVSGINGTFEIATDTKVTVTVGTGEDARDVLIFIKKNAFTQEQMDNFKEAYVVDNYTVTTGFLSYFKSGQTKDTEYDPAKYQLVVPTVISSGEKYTAEKFATDFKNVTNPICAAGDDNLDALQGVWAELAVKYNAMEAAEKANFVSSDASENVKDALARYDHIIGKYNTSEVKNLTEFVEGHTVTYAAISGMIPHDSVASSNTSIIIIVAVAVASVTGLGILLVLKRRKGLVK